MAVRQGPEVDLTVQPKQPDKSLGELFSTMTGDLSTLFRKEIELAKVEVKDDVKRAGKAGGMLGAGGFAGYMAVFFLSLALGWLLDAVLPRPLAFFIVAVIYGIAAVILLRQGRERLKHINPVPEQTVETLKEDVEWAKAQKS
jgi:hypothetical protein